VFSQHKIPGFAPHWLIVRVEPGLRLQPVMQFFRTTGTGAVLVAHPGIKVESMGKDVDSVITGYATPGAPEIVSVSS